MQSEIDIDTGKILPESCMKIDENFANAEI
jgi:hypothetical protein